MNNIFDGKQKEQVHLINRLLDNEFDFHGSENENRLPIIYNL